MLYVISAYTFKTIFLGGHYIRKPEEGWYGEPKYYVMKRQYTQL